MTDVVRYGVLGASRIARNKHIPAFASAVNATLAGVASRNGAKAAQWATELGFERSYGAYQEMLDDPHIDAIIITLPNSLHAEWAVKAAQAGKHILCEKPLATTVADAKAMFEAAEKAGVLLMEGFWTRFHPQLPFIRETIDSGAIGPVRLVRAELTYTIQDWQDDSRARSALGGGALLDAGCYCCNIIRWAMDAEPLQVQGWRRVHPDNQVDSTFAGMLAFPAGRMGFLATSMEAPFRVCCEIIGESGRIYVDTLFADSTVTISAGGAERVESFPAAGFGAQLEHFSRCVLTGAQPRVSAAESIGNTATLAALAEAAASGQAVEISL